jgi:hypothetical protein
MKSFDLDSFSWASRIEHWTIALKLQEETEQTASQSSCP